MNEIAFIFDLDGVLIDSMPLHYRAWRRAFQEFGIDITEEEIYQREGESRDITARELFTKHTGRHVNSDITGSIIRRKDRIYSRIFRVEFIPGALELLSLLKGRGVKAGLVTGATSLESLFIQHTGFLGRFDVVVDGEEPQRGKPAPDPYLLAVQRLGFPVERCYAVENAPLGIRSAVSANLTCLAVKGPSTLPEESLRAAGAHSVYKDIYELTNYILQDILPAC